MLFCSTFKVQPAHKVGLALALVLALLGQWDSALVLVAWCGYMILT